MKACESLKKWFILKYFFSNNEKDLVIGVFSYAYEYAAIYGNKVCSQFANELHCID